jgi:hypothetical protein
MTPPSKEQDRTLDDPEQKEMAVIAKQSYAAP